MVREYKAILRDKYSRETTASDAERHLNKFRVLYAVGALFLFISVLNMIGGGIGSGNVIFGILGFVALRMGIGWAAAAKDDLRRIQGHQALLDEEADRRRREARAATQAAESLARVHSPVTPTTSSLSELDRLGLTGKPKQ